MNKKTHKNKEVKESLVSPIVASISSAFVPGLGQVLAREVRRGLLLFSSFITIGGLLAWRIMLAGRRYDGWMAKISKAFQLKPILILITVLFFIIYIWIILDAYFVARRRSSGQAAASASILFFALVIFFILGWQIGEIDPVSFVSRADEAVPALSRVLWPWQRAITYPEKFKIVEAGVQSPCTDGPFPESELSEGEPFLHVDPTCGKPSEVDGAPGTLFTLTGSDFDPEEEIEIWWEDPVGNEFRQRAGGEAVVVTPDEDGAFQVDIIMPYRVLPLSAEEGPQTWRVQARQIEINCGKNDRNHHHWHDGHIFRHHFIAAT